MGKEKIPPKRNTNLEDGEEKRIKKKKEISETRLKDFSSVSERKKFGLTKDQHRDIYKKIYTKES